MTEREAELNPTYEVHPPARRGAAPVLAGLGCAIGRPTLKDVNHYAQFSDT
jgi:hypothetical protein